MSWIFTFRSERQYNYTKRKRNNNREPTENKYLNFPRMSEELNRNVIEFYSPVHYSRATNWSSIRFVPWNSPRMYQQHPVLKETINWKSFSYILQAFN